jgi:proline dehydrogenase
MPVLRSAFIALSHNRSLRKFAETSSTGTRLSSRFVAGLEIEDALRVCAKVNQQGMHVTLDSLGESVTTAEKAHRAADVYHQLLDQIAARKLDSNISVKLTQMGLTLDPALAEQIATNLTEHAQSTGNFVRIDMEDSPLTQVTLDIVRRVHARPALRPHIGIVIQAYLYRSQADIEQLIADGIRVRLCKGAYKMIAGAKAFAAQRGIDRSRFEFQMLFGVRRDLQRQLVAEGYNVRVYVPFGREWYPYFMRRLAERPANVFFIAKNMLRK